MDQVKTGNLISKKRRELCLTQKDLAKKLFVSDRAVSKWENGRSFPDSSLILKLCEILQISVYELLKGEENLNNNDVNQELMLEFIKEKEKKDKLLLSLGDCNWYFFNFICFKCGCNYFVDRDGNILKSYNISFFNYHFNCWSFICN